ncbi:hypothetical protein Vi05172_g5724 [Venturia inaequalis]|nr:hypothetical protein Vi05172_g5724 [Venturia inaequalis]
MNRKKDKALGSEMHVIRQHIAKASKTDEW